MSTHVHGILIAVVCTLLICMFPKVASADRIIDDHETGPVVLIDPTPGSGTEYATQSSLPATYFNVIYNANASSQGSTPSLNLDLSGMDRLEITFGRIDRSMEFHIRVRSDNEVRGSLYATATTPDVIEAPLTSFTNYGSINWADIDMGSVWR